VQGVGIPAHLSESSLLAVLHASVAQINGRHHPATTGFRVIGGVKPDTSRLPILAVVRIFLCRPGTEKQLSFPPEREHLPYAAFDFSQFF